MALSATKLIHVKPHSDPPTSTSTPIFRLPQHLLPIRPHTTFCQQPTTHTEMSNSPGMKSHHRVFMQLRSASTPSTKTTLSAHFLDVVDTTVDYQISDNIITANTLVLDHFFAGIWIARELVVVFRGKIDAMIMRGRCMAHEIASGFGVQWV